MSGRVNLNPYLVVSMAGLILICVFLVQFLETQTSDRIRENRLHASMRIFNDIIPVNYTNEVFDDPIQVTDPDFLGSSQPVNIYRIRNNDVPQGVIFYPIITRGYRDDIELGIGVSKQGDIYGVRVIHEEETPGIGDQISQEKTDWILMFTGKSLSNPPRDHWRVTADGGDFDQVSGATITSRSVINAVKNVLEYHENSGESLYLK